MQLNVINFGNVNMVDIEKHLECTFNEMQIEVNDNAFEVTKLQLHHQEVGMLKFY